MMQLKANFCWSSPQPPTNQPNTHCGSFSSLSTLTGKLPNSASQPIPEERPDAGLMFLHRELSQTNSEEGAMVTAGDSAAFRGVCFHSQISAHRVKGGVVKVIWLVGLIPVGKWVQNTPVSCSVTCVSELIRYLSECCLTQNSSCQTTWWQHCVAFTLQPLEEKWLVKWSGLRHQRGERTGRRVLCCCFV